MSNPDDFNSFFQENRKLVQDYAGTKLEIYRLQLIRAVSQSAGFVIWLIIAMFLAFLLFIFTGLVIGFWLSSVTGSYVTGFGITTLAMLVIIVIVTLMRRTLFVNPIIRAIIRRTAPINADDELTNE